MNVRAPVVLLTLKLAASVPPLLYVIGAVPVAVLVFPTAVLPSVTLTAWLAGDVGGVSAAGAVTVTAILLDCSVVGL